MTIARVRFPNGLRIGFFIGLVAPLIGAVVFLLGLGLVNGFGLSDGVRFTAWRPEPLSSAIRCCCSGSSSVPCRPCCRVSPPE